MAKLMIASVYDAFRAADVPDEKAREAAEDVAGFGNRISSVESDLTLIRCMLGVVIAFNVAMTATLVRLLTG